MKILKYFTILSCAFVMLFSSCNDFLDVDSDDYLKGDDNELNSPNDSVYSLFGILANLQKIGDKFIVLGELRSDLMDISIHGDKYLSEINGHATLSEDNPYLDISEYYGVINNCNYVITHMDTLVGDKSLLPDYAAAVKIRAWIYFQIAKTFSAVRYYENPILSVEDAKNVGKNTPISMDVLLQEKLIPQLLKVVNVIDPPRSLNNIPMGKMIPSTEFLLAECYLWLDQYELAATYYKQMMEKGNNGYILGSQFQNVYSGGGIRILSWSSIFTANTGSAQNSNNYEVGAAIYYRSTVGEKNKIPNLCYSGQVKPSSKVIDSWYSQENTDPNSSPETKLLGDMRGYSSSWSMTQWSSPLSNEILRLPYISKHRSDSTFGSRIIIERAPMYYLRYAEAVNRMKKPSLALAALNYGLKKSILEDKTIVNPKEIAEPSFITDFSLVKYNNSLGLRGRAGLKPIKFPMGDAALTSLNDSILFVEDVILNEAALELAFEGCRWSDLIRIGLRRYEGRDGLGEQRDFVASIIKEKFMANPDSRVPFIPSADAETVYNKLLDKDNFFIPFPGKLSVNN